MCAEQKNAGPECSCDDFHTPSGRYVDPACPIHGDTRKRTIDGPEVICPVCGHLLNEADTIPAPYAPDGSGITQADYDHAWGQTH